MLTPRRYYSRDYFQKVAPHIYGGRCPTEIVNEEVRRRLGSPPSPVGYTAQLLSVLGYSSLLGLPLVSSPTLILAGDDDPLVCTVKSKIMGAAIPDATLRIVAGAGHMLLLDSTEIVAPIVNDLLDAEQ